MVSYLTLVVILIQWVLIYPFFTKFERIKLIYVCLSVGVLTIPARWFVSDESSQDFNNQLNLFVQTIFTSLWSTICMRWSIPCLHLTLEKTNFELKRWLPISGLISTAFHSRKTLSTNFQGIFLLNLVLVIAFLWYGVGNYVLNRWTATLIATFIPTVYYVLFEYSVNFLILQTCFNFFIVLLNAAFDRCRSVIDVFPENFKVEPKLTIDNFLPFGKQMLRAFFIADYDHSSQVIEDLRNSAKILKRSKSLYFASLTFDTAIRTDLFVHLYGFSRLTDDMIDEESDSTKRRENLKIIGHFIEQLFAKSNSKTDINEPSKLQNSYYEPQVDWPYFEARLTPEQFRAFRSLSRIIYYLPSEPFWDLWRAYEWDTLQKEIIDENDLSKYSKYSASSIGTLFVIVLCHKSGCFLHFDSLPEKLNIVQRSQQLWKIFQFVDIAMDIASDSETEGRCYIPTTYLENPQDLKILREERNPWSLGEKTLKLYAMKLLKLAEAETIEASKIFSLLPKDVRGPYYAFFGIVRMISRHIAAYSGYKGDKDISKWQKFSTALGCMYFVDNFSFSLEQNQCCD